MDKFSTALIYFDSFVAAWSLAGSHVATGVRKETHEDLVFVQRWSTAAQLPERRETPYPYLTTQEGFVDWDFCGKTLTNNLGGLGPDTGSAQEMRFYNITYDSDGQGIDLVITNTSRYESYHRSINGLSGCFCTINVKGERRATKSVHLDIRTYKTGTYEPVIFSAHYVTLFDVDEAKNGRGQESITTFDGVEQVFHYPDHELEVKGTLDDEEITFKSTEWGTGVDNPTDPLNMIEMQLRRSVTVLYHNSTGWRLTFGVTDGGKGRNFLFAGKSQLANPIYAQPTPPPTPPTPYPTPAPTLAPPTARPTPSPTDLLEGMVTHIWSI